MTNDVVELTQQLIRNRCVNDGTVESGEEARNAEDLHRFLEGAGLEVERYESAPGRANLVVRIEGTDPNAPSLCLLGHTDVVPVNEDGWTRDPFGGEIVDGYLWGRGAIDMLNMTASMAVAVKNLAQSGFRPKGTLIYAAVADEEARGTYGAEDLLNNHRDAVACDYLITEAGGFPMPGADGVRLPILAEEKGPLWATMRVAGTPGHGSMPFRTDNALIKAAEIVRRLAEFRPPTRIDATWRNFIGSLGMPAEVTAALLDEASFVPMIEQLPIGMSRMAYSCTHTTITPTVVTAGTKANMIPDAATITLDIRALPGDGADEVRAMVDKALGDMASEVTLEFTDPNDIATSSPLDTPLYDALTRVSHAFYPEAALLPMRMVGTTDARHFRRALGTTSYGFGMFSEKLSLDDIARMGHGDDEKIDLDSLQMSTQLWELLARDFLG